MRRVLSRSRLVLVAAWVRSRMIPLQCRISPHSISRALLRPVTRSTRLVKVFILRTHTPMTMPMLLSMRPPSLPKALTTRLERILAPILTYKPCWILWPLLPTMRPRLNMLLHKCPPSHRRHNTMPRPCPRPPISLRGRLPKISPLRTPTMTPTMISDPIIHRVSKHPMPSREEMALFSQ